MKFSLKSISVAVLFLSACSAVNFHSNRHPSSDSHTTVAVADWVGTLQLPALLERAEDGGVWFKVLEAPEDQQVLVGKTIWLKWNERDAARAARYHARFIDVQFCAEAHKQLEQKPAPILRTRVDGWKKVSPLESLAASHNEDDMVASFTRDEVLVENNKMETLAEPLIVSGPRESVVKFKQKLADAEYLVETVSATPTEFRVKLLTRAEKMVPNTELIDTDKFLSSPLNQKGWIIQGFNQGDSFDVYAVSPYQLYSLEAAELKNITDRKDFANNRVWDLSLPNGSLQKQMVGPADYSFNEGDEFLMVHSYGYYDNMGTILGFTRGHAALGWAKVVRHGITGELIFRPGNWQVYYNSPQGVTTCKYDEVSYSGDLFRGKGFYRPISDVFVPVSALNGPNHDWDLIGKPFLEEAMLDTFAKTRLGYGDGYVMETLITSCVHDSANLLIATFKDVLNNISPKDPAYSLYKKTKDSLGAYVKVPDSFRACDKVQRWQGLGNGMKNTQSVIPRRFQDAAVRGFLKGGAPVINIKSNMITQEGTKFHAKAPYPIVLEGMIWRVLTLPFNPLPK